MSEIKEYQVLCQAAEMAERLSEGMSELRLFLGQQKELKTVSQIIEYYDLNDIENMLKVGSDVIRVQAFVKGRKAVKEFNNLPNK